MHVYCATSTTYKFLEEREFQSVLQIMCCFKKNCNNAYVFNFRKLSKISFSKYDSHKIRQAKTFLNNPLYQQIKDPSTTFQLFF